MNPRIGAGDHGDTGLFSGRRVKKSDERIEALGTIDELQSIFGMILSSDLDLLSRDILANIPHLLFDISGEIAGEGKFHAENLQPVEIKKMEDWIEFLDAKLPELHNFILPGGANSAQLINLARAVTRRAERRLLPLKDLADLRHETFVFFNRLSRLLFSVERWENFQKQGREEKWEKGRVLPEAPEK